MSFFFASENNSLCSWSDSTNGVAMLFLYSHIYSCIFCFKNGIISYCWYNFYLIEFFIQLYRRPLLQLLTARLVRVFLRSTVSPSTASLTRPFVSRSLSPSSSLVLSASLTLISASASLVVVTLLRFMVSDNLCWLCVLSWFDWNNHTIVLNPTFTCFILLHSRFSDHSYPSGYLQGYHRLLPEVRRWGF